MDLPSFRKQLRDEVSEIASSAGGDISVARHAGDAFEMWCASRFVEFESAFDTDPDDARVGGSNDLGVDLILHNAQADRLLICQCKFRSFRTKQPDEDIDSFFSLHDRLAEPGWVHEHGSQRVIDLLPDADQFRTNPEAFTYRFITTGQLSNRMQQRAGRRNGEGQPTFELWGLEQLKAFYVEAESLSQPIAQKVRIELPRDQIISIDEPFEGLLAVLKTNALWNLWQQHKQRLYAYNIRGYLGGKGLNRQIRETLTNEPEHFFYFNNGISAVCTDFQIKDDVLEARSLQIINGAQTLNAIRLAPQNPQGRVLFRLTKTQAVKTESGINEKIIRFNNAQNVVKDSDFRSNDPIQLWLEKKFKEKRWRWPGLDPRIRYVRRRQVGAPRGQGRALKLEEMAKVRYAWLNEPTAIIDAPRTLFADAEAGGRYEQAFGVNGEIQKIWPDEVLEGCLLGLLFYYDICDALDRARVNDPDNFGWIKGHRWHFLSLAGIFARDEGLSARKILRKQESHRFEEFLSRAWPLITSAEQTRAETDANSLRNWRASQQEWHSLCRAFRSARQSDRALEIALGNNGER